MARDRLEVPGARHGEPALGGVLFPGGGAVGGAEAARVDRDARVRERSAAARAADRQRDASNPAIVGPWRGSEGQPLDLEDGQVAPRVAAGDRLELSLGLGVVPTERVIEVDRQVVADARQGDVPGAGLDLELLGLLVVARGAAVGRGGVLADVVQVPGGVVAVGDLQPRQPRVDAEGRRGDVDRALQRHLRLGR